MLVRVAVPLSVKLVPPTLAPALTVRVVLVVAACAQRQAKAAKVKLGKIRIMVVPSDRNYPVILAAREVIMGMEQPLVYRTIFAPFGAYSNTAGA
jgi:hypothetical protein